MDRHNVMQMLRDVREVYGDLPLAIILDNASIHTARDVRRLASHPQMKMRLVWNIKYMPIYNSIEFFWKNAKHHYRKMV